MGKHFTRLVAVPALAALASAALIGVAPAAQAHRSGLPARAAAAYPIPSVPAPSTTPAAAARSGASSAVGYLGKLTPAALLAAGGSKLSASPSGPGTFKFVLTAKLHGKRIVIGSGSKTVDGAGAITVKLTLTTAGKHALKAAKGKKLKVTALASFTPRGGKAQTATATATLL